MSSPPEISQRVYLANAGWVLSTLWEAAKPFIPARTLDKVKIIGSSRAELEAIYADVEGGATALPSFLGGDLSPENCPQICPAMTVDAAYGVVVKEIMETFKSNLSAGFAALYPRDTQEFLDAAMTHANTFSQSSLIHQHRRDDITFLLNSR